MLLRRRLALLLLRGLTLLLCCLTLLLLSHLALLLLLSSLALLLLLLSRLALLLLLSSLALLLLLLSRLALLLLLNSLTLLLLLLSCLALLQLRSSLIAHLHRRRSSHIAIRRKRLSDGRAGRTAMIDVGKLSPVDAGSMLMLYLSAHGRGMCLAASRNLRGPGSHLQSAPSTVKAHASATPVVIAHGAVVDVVHH